MADAEAGAGAGNMAPGHTAKLHSESTTEANTTCIKPINIPITTKQQKQAAAEAAATTQDPANSQHPASNKVAAENGRRWQQTNLIYAHRLAKSITLEEIFIS